MQLLIKDIVPYYYAVKYEVLPSLNMPSQQESITERSKAIVSLTFSSMKGKNTACPLHRKLEEESVLFLSFNFFSC